MISKNNLEVISSCGRREGRVLRPDETQVRKRSKTMGDAPSEDDYIGENHYVDCAPFCQAKFCTLQGLEEVAIDFCMATGNYPIDLFKVQSEDVTRDSGDADDQRQTIMSYVDQDAGTHVKFNPIQDNSFYSSYRAEASLAQFLSRPVRIATFQWDLASNFNTVIQPWEAYFNDTRIRKKIDNYGLLSCNLKIKVVLNASPFYYGCCLVSYLPLSGFTISTVTNVATYDDDLVPYSQRPHIYLYPQNNQGGEMTLPFFNYKPWLNVNSQSEFLDMGSLRFIEVGPLQNANSIASGTVDIQVYAWAEDVCVAGPTVALAIQSKDEYDETGPISGVASAIATAAGYLEKVPIIGPYMTATSVVSNAISSVAKYFGFTNTPVVHDVMPFKNLPFHSFSSSEISEPIDRLTFDPKNELSIDPRIAGLDGTDELGISYLCGKESYFERVAWTSARVPDDLLFACEVQPDIAKINGVWRQSTPVGHLCKMFEYWRGPITFRFRFICSKYHRGRVVIAFDPIGDFSGTDNIVNQANISNAVYNRIVDIAEETDVYITMPFMQPFEWCRVDTGNFTERFNTTGAGIVRNIRNNGIFTVRVLTKQTSPVPSADINMLVSVLAPDIEFANPRELPSDISVYPLQSQDEVEYDHHKNISLDSGNKPDSNRYLIAMGEKLTSFRQVLRRVSYSRSIALSTDSTNLYRLAYFKTGRIPLEYGYDTVGIDLAKGTLVPANDFNFNFATNHPINWVRHLFVGMRGSINLHVNTNSPEALASVRIYRDLVTRSSSDHKLEVSLGAAAGVNEIPRWFLEHYKTGAGGQSLTHQLTQTGFAVNLPMYNRFRFVTTDKNDTTNGWDVDDTDIDTIRHCILTKPRSQDAHEVSFDYYYGIGPDFTCLFFVNVPTMVQCALPPFTP